MFADWKKLRLHDCIQGHGIDGCAGPLCNDEKQGALELEIDKEGDVIGALFTLGEFGKNQEASPALAGLGNAHTLPDGSHGFQVAFGHTARLDNAHRAEVAV